MTVVFKDLQKLVSQQQQEKARDDLYDRLINKRFWIWHKEQHKQEDIRTDGDCCFNHIIGLPQKDGQDKPLYDYEQIIFDSLHGNNKHLWIKKATGLGVSEFMLRFMAWLCLKDNTLSGSQMCIVFYDIVNGHEDPINITDVRLFQPVGFIPVKLNKLPPTIFDALRNFFGGISSVEVGTLKFEFDKVVELETPEHLD